MSQAALLVLVEQDLVGQSEVEQKVCPMILKLTETDRPVEFHTGAVAVRFLRQISIMAN
jgi:hypothetical protein